MKTWIVLPIKPPGVGKSRLASALGAAERQALIVRMLRHVVAAAGAIDADVHLLGHTRHGLPDRLPLIGDCGRGLNAAFAGVPPVALAARVDRLVFVSTDLARVTSDDLAALMDDDPATVVIAPDRAGIGTNALSLPLPAAAAFGFGYGPDSFARHGAEIGRLGLLRRIVRSPTLALDIDTPADLALLAAADDPGPGDGPRRSVSPPPGG